MQEYFDQEMAEHDARMKEFFAQQDREREQQGASPETGDQRAN